MKNLPFNLIKKLNAPWIDEVKTIVEKKIDESIAQLKEEAEYEGDVKFSNEKFLYERFKDNIENKLVFGNYQVLKYFYRIMKIKLYRLIIGRNTFNAHDKEMYNYFINVKVNEKTKCKHALLKFKSATEITDYSIRYNNQSYFLTYIFKTNKNSPYMDILNVPYFDYYNRAFSAIDDMIRNVKMQEKNNINFFDDDDIFNPLKLHQMENKKVIEISTEYLEEVENKKYISQYDFEKIADSFELFCKRDDEYNKLYEKYNLKIKELFKDFSKTEKYKNFPVDLRKNYEDTYCI